MNIIKETTPFLKSKEKKNLKGEYLKMAHFYSYHLHVLNVMKFNASSSHYL
jgi:hypothetical protein